MPGAHGVRAAAGQDLVGVMRLSPCNGGLRLPGAIALRRCFESHQFPCSDLTGMHLAAEAALLQHLLCRFVSSWFITAGQLLLATSGLIASTLCQLHVEPTLDDGATVRRCGCFVTSPPPGPLTVRLTPLDSPPDSALPCLQAAHQLQPQAGVLHQSRQGEHCYSLTPHARLPFSEEPVRAVRCAPIVSQRCRC